jgi:hypothetical protein
MKLTDNRYSVNLEFCGHAEQKHVVRFCGEFIASFDDYDAANVAALNHCLKNKRGVWDLVTTCEGVLWLKHNRRPNFYRVVYGADITDYKSDSADSESAIDFGLCVHHSVKCQGKLEN